jgi:8-oxo-dGTP pyrophosphatase MutT (NUDIX family)
MSDPRRGRVYSGRIVSLDIEDVLLPDGATRTFEFVRHPGGAAVVALDAASQVCLLRQWRPAVDEWVWELPAGKRDGAESPATTAHRELREETGRDAAHWESLGGYIASPGVFCERVELFLARELTTVPTALEPGEVLEVHWVPLAEACRRALDGAITDGKTVCGLLRAQHRLT